MTHVDRINMLEAWMDARTSDDARQWLHASLAAIRQETHGPAKIRQLSKALGLAARKLGKADLQLFSDDLAHATTLCAGVDPSNWSIDQAARVAFILASYQGDDAAFAAQLDELADTAEINELIALYAGFPLYPAANLLEPRAREAIRSSMRPVFEAMAHRNPYPASHFDDAAWNQMVVKTFFLDSPLWPVVGIETRNNRDLALILLDLAHERRAAGRAISPELWRCVVPFSDELGQASCLQVLASGSETEQLAIALSLPPTDNGQAKLIRQHCEHAGLLPRSAHLSWPALLSS